MALHKNSQEDGTTPISFDSFALHVTDWCALRAKQMSQMVVLDQWESWVQTDFAAYLASQNDSVSLLRYPNIYRNERLSAHWMFNSTSSSIQHIVVEICAQSQQNRSLFHQSLKTNLQKLQPNSLKTEYQDAQRAIMAVYFDADARSCLLSNRFIEVFNNGEVGCCIRRLN